MLRTMYNEVKTVVCLPGMWIICFIFDLLGLIIDLTHYDMFGVAGDLFLMCGAVILYFVAKVRK